MISISVPGLSAFALTYAVEDSSKLFVFIALLVFIAISVWLGTMAQRLVSKGSFLTSFFLGNRGLGVWTMALTATVQSGGTFMGFPSLVYRHGWVVLVWIAGYMVVPLISFGLFAKRLAHLSRQTKAITVPDLFRKRFDSPALGLISSLLILLMMTIMIIAQFKAGAIIMKISWPFGHTTSPTVTESVTTTKASPDSQAPAATVTSETTMTVETKTDATTSSPDYFYYVGLVVFAATVIGYTLIGGFMASVWTDLFQSVMMLIGVVVLLYLTMTQVGGLEAATQKAVDNTSLDYVYGPGHGAAFLPVGLAFSFFFLWPFAGTSTPASIVRVMAAQKTEVLRRSISVLCIYNLLIYIPLVIICIAGRAILPDVAKPDEIIPTLALTVTDKVFAGPFWAAIVMAAPFGAVMATVSCYLLVIASGLVRDIYLRFIHPTASYREIRVATNLSMLLVGAVAIGANIRPVQYLQAMVVLSSSMAGGCFLVPVVMTCYWKRATAQGAMAAMIGGGLTIAALFAARIILLEYFGYDQPLGTESIRPYYLFQLDSVIWGVLVSGVLGIIVSLLTRPMDAKRIEQFFPSE